jgi:adhesin transport system outer membrane protein
MHPVVFDNDKEIKVVESKKDDIASVFFVPNMSNREKQEVKEVREARGVRKRGSLDGGYGVSTINSKGDDFNEHLHGMSIQDIVRRVVGWHPLIKRAESEILESDEVINESLSAYYPKVDAKLQSGFDDVTDTNEKESRGRGILSVDQMIYDFGKTKSKVELSKAKKEKQLYDLHKDINDIVYETVNAYFQIVKYKNLVHISRVQVKGFKEISDIARKRARLGASAGTDYSQSKVKLTSAISLLYDTEAQYHKWSATLDNLASKEISKKISLRIDEEIAGSCQLNGGDYLNSPRVKVAEAQLDMAKKQMDYMSSDFFPRVSISPTYEHDFDNSRRKNGRLGVFLNVTASLYEGGASSSRTRQAEQAVYAAKYNLDVEKNDVKKKMLESSSQVDNIKHSLKEKIKREKEAVITRDLYRLQYLELGSRSFSDLISAESEVHQTRMEIENSKFNINSYSIDCLYQSGVIYQYFSAI